MATTKKKTPADNSPIEEKRYTSYFPTSDIDKMAFIAWHDRKDKKNVWAAAIATYIASFEKKHGVINDEQLKEARVIK